MNVRALVSERIKGGMAMMRFLKHYYVSKYKSLNTAILKLFTVDLQTMVENECHPQLLWMPCTSVNAVYQNEDFYPKTLKAGVPLQALSWLAWEPAAPDSTNGDLLHAGRKSSQGKHTQSAHPSSSRAHTGSHSAAATKESTQPVPRASFPLRLRGESVGATLTWGMPQ